MANNAVQTVDTQAAQLAVQTNNALTAFMTSSESWKLFMSNLPAPQQKQIPFDVFAYVSKHPDTVSKMKPNEFMGQVIIAYSMGYTLQEGDCYILPFRDGKTGEQVATLVPGYKGIVRLATQTGLFKHFDATPIIRESIAKFDHRRGVPIFNEQYIPNGNEKIIGYYGYSETYDGMVREIYHSNEYFEDFAHRKSPQNKGKNYLVGTWKDDFNGMCLKTIYKELGKLAPKTKNPTQQQQQFYEMLETDDEQQPERPSYIDVDGVVVNEPEEPLPFDEPLEDYDDSQDEDNSKLVCSACGAEISEKVYNYSMDNFGKPLCYPCQKKQKPQ